MNDIDEKLRYPLKLSVLLHGIEMDVDEIFSEKSLADQEAIKDVMLGLIPQGCKVYVELMGEARDYDAESESDRFLFSPHSISIVDALTIALGKTDQFTLRQEAELFASLAKLLVTAIPFDLKWGVSKNADIKNLDPFSLIEIGVRAADAMNAIHEARHRISIDLMPEDKLAKKVSEVISDQAKKNAGLAHVEHRAMKSSVFDWCEKNLSNFKSMDQAAQAIAGVEVPVAFTTARSWIREWKKQNSLLNKSSLS